MCTAWALTYGFDELHLHRIQLEVLATNDRAIRVYERLGFLHEGRKRHAQFKAGRYVDVLVMAVLEDEWLQRREILVECAADAVS